MVNITALKVLYMMGGKEVALIHVRSVSRLKNAQITQPHACLHACYLVSGHWRKLDGVRFLGTRQSKAKMHCRRLYFGEMSTR